MLLSLSWLTHGKNLLRIQEVLRSPRIQLEQDQLEQDQRLPRNDWHGTTKDRQYLDPTEDDRIPRRMKQHQLNRDWEGVDSHAGPKDTAQRIIRFAKLKLSTKMAGQGGRIGRTQGNRKIHIMSRPRNPPSGGGKPSDQSIVIHQAVGLRLVEATHDVG